MHGTRSAAAQAVGGGPIGDDGTVDIHQPTSHICWPFAELVSHIQYSRNEPARYVHLHAVHAFLSGWVLRRVSIGPRGEEVRKRLRTGHRVAPQNKGFLQDSQEQIS